MATLTTYLKVGHTFKKASISPTAGMYSGIKGFSLVSNSKDSGSKLDERAKYHLSSSYQEYQRMTARNKRTREK